MDRYIYANSHGSILVIKNQHESIAIPVEAINKIAKIPNENFDEYVVVIEEESGVYTFNEICPLSNKDTFDQLVEKWEDARNYRRK